MKQTKYRFVLTALAALMLLATSCSKEPQGEDFGDGTYLSLNIDGVKASTSAQSTRATAVNETAVNDLWVLQFQMNAGSTTVGTLVAKSYIATVTDPAKVKFRPIEGNNTALYLVANSGNSSLFSSTANGTTLATVKAAPVSVSATAGNNFPTETSANLPMVGQSATLKLPTTTAVPVTLTRVTAKVVLTIKNSLAAGYPQLTVTSTQLKNVPTYYLMQIVDAANGFTGTTYYPMASTTNFKDYTATTGNITATGKTSTYYLAPNVRGMGTNTDPRLKSDLTAPSGQGSFCTYVEILGTAKASASAPAVDVRYRLYLGANNTNNFNLYANTAYKVDIELTGINGNDARMTITTDKFDLIQGGTDGDYTGDAGDGWRPPAIGDFINGGIVYWVDGANYKVVSLEETSTTKWAAAVTYVVSGAQSDTDGKANSKAIRDYFDANKSTVGTDFDAAFPAAAYCYNYRGKAGSDAPGSWYLPAKHELQYLWCAYNGKAPSSWTTGNPNFTADATAQAVFNKYLTNAGGGVIASGGFWSSTENSGSTSYAWYVAFSNGNTSSYGGKGNDGYVRCVKHIVPPPPPVVGDYYYSDGSYSTALDANKTATGMIYYVNSADPTKFKVVSLEELSTLKWAAKNTYVVTAAQSDADGRANSEAIKAAFDAKVAGVAITESTFDAAFPAAAYCYNYKGKANTDALGSWYLPAKSELQYLWCAFNGKAPISWASNTHTDATPVPDAQAVFNKSLTNAGGAAITSGSFWSSTEYSSNTSNAWYVYFSNGSTSSSGKGNGSYVRCVREF